MQRESERGQDKHAPAPSPAWPEWLDIHTLAAYSSISERKLRDLLKDGLPHVRLGRLIRVSRTQFDQWMQQRGAQQREQSTTLLEQIRASRPRPYSRLEDRHGPSSHCREGQSRYNGRIAA